MTFERAAVDRFALEDRRLIDMSPPGTKTNRSSMENEYRCRRCLEGKGQLIARHLVQSFGGSNSFKLSLV